MKIYNNIWHPFTKQKHGNNVLHIVSGKDSVLYDDEGKEYIDLVSSWWCNIHGHGNIDIANAITEQANRLEHVLFAGCTHKPAIELAENIIKHMPDCLNKVFFSDNGSTSIEAAMKIAYQYHVNIGNSKRDTYIAFSGAYHGDTFGAMSISTGDSTTNKNYHSIFKQMLCKCDAFRYPYVDDSNIDIIDTIESSVLKHLTEYLQHNSNKVIALFIEPLIQGAAGMRICRPIFLDHLLDICRKYDVITVFDEIMTGFYRTGKMFAFDSIHNKPNIVCISKALTGGFLPLGLTLVDDEIYKAFYSDNDDKTFNHGHTYTGNPLSCAAANMSYKLLMLDETQSNIRRISQFIKDNFTKLKSIPIVKSVRTLGCIGAFDVNSSADVVKELVKNLVSRGLLMRPLFSETLYWMPPYCTTIEQLEYCFEIMCDELRKIC